MERMASDILGFFGNIGEWESTSVQSYIYFYKEKKEAGSNQPRAAHKLQTIRINMY